MEKLNNALYAFAFNEKLARRTQAVFVIGTLAIVGIVVHEVNHFINWYAEPFNQQFVAKVLHSFFG